VNVNLLVQPNVTISPMYWAPGQAYNVTVTDLNAEFYALAPPPATSLFIFNQSQYPGPGQFVYLEDPNVTHSAPTYVSPTTATFTATVAAGASSGNYGLNFSCHQEGFVEAPGFIVIAPCLVPQITSVSPNTWVGGKKYDGVTVTGTGFTTSSAATSTCPATTLRFSTGTGKAQLANVNVVSSTSITFTVTSMPDDMSETLTLTASGTPPATATAQVTGCVLPYPERTAFNGWDGTLGKWKQTILMPTDINFSGVSIQEAASGVGTDSCWFEHSLYHPFTSITPEAPWTVNWDNTWGDDSVGWNPESVTFYRALNRAPCGATFYQQMTMACLNSDGTTYTYKDYGPVNTLGAGITATTVSSTRAGQTQTRSY